jgi:septal ring factor EnvC (AmiA/AmiB activator)
MNENVNTVAPPTADRFRPLAQLASSEARHCIDLLAELYGRALVTPIGACVTQLSDMLDDTLARWEHDLLRAEADRENLRGRIARLEADQAKEDADSIQSRATITGLQARIEALEAAMLTSARSRATARKKIRDAERRGVAATLDCVSEHHAAA